MLGNPQLATGNLLGGVALQVVVVLAVADIVDSDQRLMLQVTRSTVLFQHVALLVLLAVAIAWMAVGEPVSVAVGEPVSVADLALHGHAHGGREKDTTPGDVPVRNVAQSVIRTAYRLYCIGGLGCR